MNTARNDNVDDDSIKESNPLIRRLGDGLLAILVSLVAWGGYYVQTLAGDIRTLGVQVVVLQQKMEKINEMDKDFHARIYDGVLSTQRVVDLERRMSVFERSVEEHMKSYAHAGASKDIALMLQRLSVLEDRFKKSNVER